jgi:hypothetical protein
MDSDNDVVILSDSECSSDEDYSKLLFGIQDVTKNNKEQKMFEVCLQSFY